MELRTWTRFWVLVPAPPRVGVLVVYATDDEDEATACAALEGGEVFDRRSTAHTRG